jgi:hypothetical protein
VDLEKKTPVRVDTDTYARPFTLNPVWSPDSRWLAYTEQLRNHLHAEFAYSLEQAKSYQLMDGMSDALYATFDKEGKYLYFTASTNAALSMGWLDMTSLQRLVTRSVYVMVLKKDLPSPLAPESDEEKPKEAEKSDKDKQAEKDKAEKPVTVEIDLENISQRILALPIPARNYQQLDAGKPGVLYLVEGPLVDPLKYEDGPPPSPYTDSTSKRGRRRRSLRASLPSTSPSTARRCFMRGKISGPSARRRKPPRARPHPNPNPARAAPSSSTKWRSTSTRAQSGSTCTIRSGATSAISSTTRACAA